MKCYCDRESFVELFPGKSTVIYRKWRDSRDIFTTKYGTRAVALARVDVCAVLRCTGTKRGLVIFAADQIDRGRVICGGGSVIWQQLRLVGHGPLYGDFHLVKVRRFDALLILPLDTKLQTRHALFVCVCFFPL